MTTTFPGPAATATGRWKSASFAAQVAALAGRQLSTSVRDPQEILFALLQPLVLLFMFTQVFAALTTTTGFPAGLSYVDYLMPAILLTNALQQAMQSGSGLVEDLHNGFLARLRSMPVHPIAPLVARSCADLAFCGLQLVVMLGIAIALFGYRPSGGLAGAATSLLLAMVVCWGVGWVFLALGSWLRRAQTMQNISIVAVFPVTIISSAYVPLSALPGWVRAIATLNPLTYAVDTMRALALGLPGGGFGPAALTVAISAVLAVGGALAALPGFRRPL
ncbi:ABC transporter permease [Amycolatopsis benzoatilytica]|uniref:ABC transporter permease n=1 Tax=Amycolatopsis benzoatilytica TaxID=346045 RepID=UPI00036F7C56|nr:ABC transporter permease [Amycolatopsis benzoatilytica]